MTVRSSVGARLRPDRQRIYPLRGLHGEVVHALGRRIVHGAIQPGQTLPNETELTAQLGVSRSVLREAIKVLAAKGLVELRTRTGTRVRPRGHWRLLDPDVLDWLQQGTPDRDFMRNLTEVRSIIEPWSARLAAERATADDVAGLARAYQEMEASVGDVDVFIDADMAFHRFLTAAAHNELLEQIGSAIDAGMLASRRITVRRPGSSSASLPKHRAVLEAIQSGDPGAAEEAMMALLHRAADDIDAVLSAPERGSDGQGGVL